MVKGINLGEQELGEAQAGQSVALTLNDEVDVSRGDVLASVEEPLEVADQFQAHLLWMAEAPLSPGRSYLLKLHTQEVSATVTEIKYREDVNSSSRLAAKQLQLNEIAVVNLSTSHPLVFEPYAQSRTLGGFILIDKLTFATLGAGMLDFALRRASNIHWQALEISKAQRAAQKSQTPRCIWFTGLSGSGGSPPLLRCWKRSSMPRALIPTCLMETMSDTGLIGIWVSPRRTEWRTCAASLRSLS